MASPPLTLPEVTVLEIIDFDDNGDGMAQLAGNEIGKRAKSVLFLAANLDARQQLASKF